MLAFATAIAFAVLPYGAIASESDSAVVEIAARVNAAYQPGDAIGTYKVFVRNLVFYSHRPHTDIIHDEHLRDWLAKHTQALVVMPAADAERLEHAGLRMQRLAERRYFNEGALRVRQLLWPDPSTDLERVVLARIMGGLPPAATSSRD
jgi:hypothetical protein